MNCQEFESRVELLARGALADARTRAEAAAHEESCGACAARLADERALSTGLRALATEMKDAEAPARVESALLAAFRSRAAEVTDGDAAANVIPLSGRPRVVRWSWAKTGAVASLAAAASLALFVLVRPGAGLKAPGASQEVAGSGARAKMLEPPPGGSGQTSARDVAQATPTDVEEPESSPAAGAPGEKASRASYAPRARALNASYGAGGSRGALSRPAAAAESRAQEQEIATEFIPLVQGGQYAQAEEGHLVRVELPRSALASFGLPVNAEASGGRVKADVLLGEDGTARAIRFVR